MKVKHLFFAMIVAAFLSSAISFDNTVSVGDKAPKIETAAGEDIKGDFKNQDKNRIVSFWSPKKPSSRISNRNFYNEFISKGDIDFISICVDPDENLMKEVLRIDGINEEYNHAFSSVSPRVFKDYDVEDNPRSFLISPEGKILKIMI